MSAFYEYPNNIKIFKTDKKYEKIYDINYCGGNLYFYYCSTAFG